MAEERLTIVPQAIGHQEAILGIDPQNLDAASALERLYGVSEKPAELAGVYLRKAEILEDPQERKDYLLRAAEIYETLLERPEDAIAAYRRINEIDESDVPALDALIRLYITHERWNELLGVYDKKSDLVHDPDEKKKIFFDMATVYEGQLNDPVSAIAAYNKVLELDPADVTAIERLDHLYQAQGNWTELLGVLEREADLAGDPAAVDGVPVPHRAPPRDAPRRRRPRGRHLPRDPRRGARARGVARGAHGDSSRREGAPRGRRRARARAHRGAGVRPRR